MYWGVVNRWEEEALANQSTSFPLGSSPNFSCRIWKGGTLTQLNDFASAPNLSKAAVLSEMLVPASDSVKSDFVARRRLADLLLVQNLVIYLGDAVREFQHALPKFDPMNLWASMHMAPTWWSLGFADIGF